MYNLITILGPTASGKTNLACHLAKLIDGEIISADSRQVYRKMDIGTGKDIEEYTLDGVEIPYHLIDIKDPGYKYNIAEFQVDFIEAFNAISSKGKVPILCGGSGLYLETALQGHSYLGIPSNEALWAELKELSDEALDERYKQILPEVLESLNSETRPRKIRAIEIATFLEANKDWQPVEIPELNPLIIGVDINRELRREKITRRLSERMNNGLIEEAEGLLASGEVTHADLEYYGLEYKWVGKYLLGEIDKRTLFERLNVAIHQFAKRQMTWYRRMEKNGYKIQWVDASQPIERKLNAVLQHLNA